MKKLKFRRQGLGSRKKVKPVWKKPRGWGSKQRKKKKGRRTAMPNISYRSPKKRRVKELLLISNIKELSGLKKGTVIILKSNIGAKKKIELLNACIKNELIVKNYKKTQEAVNKLRESFKKSKDKRDKELNEKLKKKKEDKKRHEDKAKKEEVKKKTVKIKKKTAEKKSFKKEGKK